MKLVKWDDGYVLEQDPRREDPLYYYMRPNDWDTAIGWEVEPLYHEHSARKVSIRIYEKHLPQEAGLDPQERQQMYQRMIPVLLKRHRKWQHVTLHTSHLSEVLHDSALAAAFTAAGFIPGTSATLQEHTWTKA